MYQVTRCLVVAAVLVAAPLAAQADETYNPKAIADTIAPLIDWETYAVVRINVEKVNVEAVGGWLVQALGVPAEKATEPAKALAAWREAFLASGAREIFILRSTAAPLDAPPALIVPLSRESKPGEVAAALRRPLKEGDPKRKGPFGKRGVVMQVRRFLVATTNPRRDRRLQTIKPEPRPELADAFAAAGDTAIQIILTPSEDHRRIVEETTAQLPVLAPPVPTTVLTKGLRWAAIGITLPPTPSVEVVIQSADEQAAAAFSQSIAQTLDTIARLPDFRRVIAPGEPARLLTPQQSGSRLIIELNAGRIGELNRTVFLPMLQQSRTLARQAVSAANLRGIGQALAMHAIERGGQRPARLQVLVDAGLLSPKYLLSPLGKQAPYVYIRPPADARDDTLVAYDDPKSHGMTKTAVLFHDTRVEMLAADDLFTETISHARMMSAAAYDIPTEAAQQ